VSKLIPLPWTRWLILWSLAGILLAIAPQPNDTVAVTTWQQATQLATEGERRKAAETFQLVIARRPFDPQPWRQLGDLYVAWGQPDAAHHAYGQAIRRGERGAALNRGLAQLYVDLGDRRQAARRWTNYLAYRPDDRIARLILAQIAIRLADWGHARTQLEHLLAEDSDDPWPHAWLGLLLIDSDPATGVFHLQQAADDPALSELVVPLLDAERLSTASDDPAYRSTLLGAAFLKLGRHLPPDIANNQAIAPALLSYRALEREFTQATSMLALRSLLVAVNRNPAYADAYAYLGHALDQLGWSGWARASFETAVRLAPQSTLVLTLTGLYWDRHGNPTLARDHYLAAYHQERDNAALCLDIATTYSEEGEYTAAEVWLLYAIEITPDAPEVWEALARFYLEHNIGVQESGLPAANRLLELAPGDARAHDLVGWAYFLTEKDTQAEASLNQALSLDPSLASAHYHLGRLYARQGHYAQAIQAYHLADGYDVYGQLAAELDRAWSDLPQAYRQ
jgi:tetratricopeptide (TPR) repeat protein